MMYSSVFDFIGWGPKLREEALHRPKLGEEFQGVGHQVLKKLGTNVT